MVQRDATIGSPSLVPSDAASAGPVVAAAQLGAGSAPAMVQREATVGSPSLAPTVAPTDRPDAAAGSKTREGALAGDGLDDAMVRMARDHHLGAASMLGLDSSPPSSGLALSPRAARSASPGEASLVRHGGGSLSALTSPVASPPAVTPSRCSTRHEVGVDGTAVTDEDAMSKAMRRKASANLDFSGINKCSKSFLRSLRRLYLPN
jgi:hypothetical protein